MRLSNKRNQGFTLIEIIIVVVILGILAAIAIPKITQNIGRAVAAEAFQIGDAYAKAVDRCLADLTAGVAPTAANVAACTTFAQINMINPSGAAPLNFASYTPVAAAGVITLTATPNAKNGIVAADTIVFTVNGLTGAVAKTCYGNFAAMCK